MAVTATRTLPDHARCDTHKRYRLSCGQYEQLLERSGQCCEICRRPGSANTGGKLFIDHDVSPWGVRGLLCVGCNSQLSYGNEGWPTAAEYLENSWWQQQCKALGYPTHGLPPEPPAGSAIRTQWGIIFLRGEDHWDAPSQDGHHPSANAWDWLHRSYGPHNLVPYDLRSAYDDNSMPSEVRYAIVNGFGWGPIRKVLGLPEPEPKKRYRPIRPRDTLPWLASPERAAEALRSFLEPDECRRIAELLLADPGASATDEQVA